MAAGLLAIDIYGGFIVYRAEVQKYRAVALRLGEGDLFLIPYTADKVLVSHTGKLTFGAEGDDDLTVQGSVGLGKTTVFAGSALVDLKCPAAVEVQPGVTHKLGLGMFTSRDHKETLLYIQ